MTAENDLEGASLRQRIDHLWPDIPWIEPKVQRCKKGLHEMTQANSGQGRNYRGAYTYCIACRQARRSA